jgi:Mg2+/citrate symporter
MSYQEKRVMVFMITVISILGAYWIYTYGKYQSGAIATDDMKFWAGTMLLFIGISIVAAIVIQIIFHILLSMAIVVQEKTRTGQYDDKEIKRTIESEMVTDEMDKLIKLKSIRIGYIVVGIGFITALVSQVFNFSSAVMINIIFVSFYAGSLFEGLTQFYFYRKGVSNG